MTPPIAFGISSQDYSMQGPASPQSAPIAAGVPREVPLGDPEVDRVEAKRPRYINVGASTVSKLLCRFFALSALGKTLAWEQAALPQPFVTNPPWQRCNASLDIVPMPLFMGSRMRGRRSGLLDFQETIVSETRHRLQTALANGSTPIRSINHLIQNFQVAVIKGNDFARNWALDENDSTFLATRPFVMVDGIDQRYAIVQMLCRSRKDPAHYRISGLNGFDHRFQGLADHRRDRLIPLQTSLALHVTRRSPVGVINGAIADVEQEMKAARAIYRTIVYKPLNQGTEALERQRNFSRNPFLVDVHSDQRLIIMDTIRGEQGDPRRYAIQGVWDWERPALVKAATLWAPPRRLWSEPRRFWRNKGLHPKDTILWAASGPRLEDANQGLAGNCVLISTLKRIAQHRPQYLINNVVTLAQPGHYVVQLFDLDAPWLARNYHVDLAYTPARLRKERETGKTIVWPRLFENAFAQATSDSQGSGDFDPNIFEGIAYGRVNRILVGGDSWLQTNQSLACVAPHIAQEAPLRPLALASTDTAYPSLGLVAWHAYAVSAITSPERGPAYLELVNPWGYNPIPLHPRMRGEWFSEFVRIPLDLVPSSLTFVLLEPIPTVSSGMDPWTSPLNFPELFLGGERLKKSPSPIMPVAAGVGGLALLTWGIKVSVKRYKPAPKIRIL